MGRGAGRKQARPAERTKRPRLPQNLRGAPGAFDPSQSRVKAVADWDDADLRDEQDEFLDGKDKVLLEHQQVADDGELDLPDEVFPVLGSDPDDAVDDEEEETLEPKRKQRKAKTVDATPKGRFAKQALQGPASSSSDTEADSASDQPALDDAAVVGSSGDDSDDVDSSDPDAEAWGSYHVSHPTAKRRAKRVEEVDAAEEAENKKLELAEAMRLQKRARDRLKESDFLPFAGLVKEGKGEEGDQDEALVLMGQGGGVDVEALAREPARFEGEGEAIAFLLKERPEALALVDDFRRQLPVLRELEKELKGVTAISTAGGDDDVNESLESFRWLHYHTLSTYLSCVAFYFRVLLTAPPASLSSPKSLIARVTNTLSALRKTLADLEDQGLTGDDDPAAAGDGEEEEEEAATVEELEALQKVLRRQGFPAGLGDLEEDELKELLEGQLLSPPQEAEPVPKSNGVVSDRATKKPRRKKRPSKSFPSPTLDDEDDVLDLRPRPPVAPTVSDPTTSLDDDFLDPLTLSSTSAEDKDRKRRAIRFHTDKISAKRKRREAATGTGQGDEEVAYKTREERRREALRRQRHGGARDDGEEEGEGKAEGKAKRKRAPGGEGEAYYDVVKELKESAKRAKKAQHDEQRLAEREILSTEADSAGPRSATRQILANKGLTPKRNKLDRNPRVKKRKRYEKAQRTVSSQRSVFKPQEAQKGRSGAYEGEKSGIRSGVVKSRKL